jgi:leucine-zipper of insertion element IS481
MFVWGSHPGSPWWLEVSNATISKENRMELHANARTCPKSRRLLVDRIEDGWSVMEAAEAAGITDRTARRWMARWRAEGAQGLLDRSCAPKRIPHRTPPERVREIVRLRRLRMTAAQSALSRPSNTSGPMAASSRPAPIAPQHSDPG